MKIVIDRNVPLPKRSTGRPRTYPFDKMGVGESFEIPHNKHSSVRQCAFSYGKRNKKKFAIRRVDADTFRCWRVK